MDWLVGQDRSLYFAAGRDRLAAWTRKAPKPLHLVLTNRAVWYLRCGNWNGMTSPPPPPPPPPPFSAAAPLARPPTPLIVVGRGRVGRSLAAAAERAEIEIRLVAHEDLEAMPRRSAILLCVPDDAIAVVARELAPAEPALVGHVSGATTLDALAAGGKQGAASFSLHPLQTFADGETPLEGTPAAIAGSTEESLSYARSLAEALGMRPFEVAEEKRAA